MALRARLGHVGINCSNSGRSFRFWKDLLGFLGFSITAEKNHFDASDGTVSLCVQVAAKKATRAGFHRQATGLNHIAFRVASRTQVDEFVEAFLKPRRIESLYGGAKSYPEYGDGYYAVYFEDPDRIKIEVVFEPVYTGS